MKSHQFVVTGLLSGVLSWLLLSFLPLEYFLGEVVVMYIPGIIIAIMLLMLGKNRGMVADSNTTTSLTILIVVSFLAQFFIEQYQASELHWWELGFYPAFYVGGDLSIYELSPLYILPSPITLAIHSMVMALGVAFAWDVPTPFWRVFTRSALYGVLFGLVMLLLTYLSSSAVSDLVYNIQAIADQEQYSEQRSRLSNYILLVTLLLWHAMLLLSIYKVVKPRSSTEIVNDKMRGEENLSAALYTLSTSTKVIKSEKEWRKKPSSFELIAQFKARKKSVRLFFWGMCGVGVMVAGGMTYYYQSMAGGAYDSLVTMHKDLVKKHIVDHPLYRLWPELKACGMHLKSMKDLLREQSIPKEVEQCEVRLMERLKKDRNEWLITLKRETDNLRFYVSSELLVQSNAPEHPSYAINSALRECGSFNELSEIVQVKGNNASLTPEQVHFVACLEEKQERIQKSLDSYTDAHFEQHGSLHEEYGDPAGFYAVSDYQYFRPAWKEASAAGYYWDDYRVDVPGSDFSSYPPTGSFQEALNRSWKFGEVIQPVEIPGERDIYFHNGKMELLTPIVIDGETQAIVLSRLNVSDLDEDMAAEWQQYRNILVPTLIVLMIVFFWYEYTTLARIPQVMNLRQWKVGMWRPSMITLYQVDGFRYFHMFNMLFFLFFSALLFVLPAHELWREELTWFMWLQHIMAVMLLPMIFGVLPVFRMVVDYRLFSQGIPVSCNKIGEKTEKLITGYVREDHDRHLYEAHYRGKTYNFSAPAVDIADGEAIALINPKIPKHALLLNAFYEGD